MWGTNLMILLLSTASIAKPKSYDTSIHWIIEDRFPDDIESDLTEEVNTEAAIAIIPLPESVNESNEYHVFRNQGKNIHISNRNNTISADATNERVPIWKSNIELTNTLESVEDEIIFGRNDKQTTIPMVNAGKAMPNTITERLPTLNSNKKFVSKEITGTMNVKRYLVVDKNDVIERKNATKDMISATNPKKEIQSSKEESVEEVNVTRKRNNVTKYMSTATIAKKHAQKNYSKENMTIVDNIKPELNNKKETASKKSSDSFKNYLSLDGDEMTLDDRGIFDTVDNCPSDQVYDKNLGRCMGLSAEVPPEDDFSNLLIFT